MEEHRENNFVSIRWDELVLGREIGRGAFKTVYEVCAVVFTSFHCRCSGLPHRP